MSWKDDRKSIKLEYPITWGKDSQVAVTELSFRAPKAKDIMDIGQDIKFGAMIEIAGNCVDHEGGSMIIEELHAKDAIAVVGVIGDFLADSPKTGN